MTCKHNWNFVDGLTKRIRCTRCAAMEFVNPQESLTIPDAGYSFRDPRPNNIIFYNTAGGAQVEVLRISQLGITANPDIPTDEAADAVLRALDGHIKSMVHRPWVKQMKGVRVQGDTVVISTKDNDAARELCGALIEEMNK